MKLRHPALIRCASRLGAGVLRRWMGTLRISTVMLGPDVDPRRPELAGRYVYSLWHEHLLLPACLFAVPKIHVLISQHADGQLIAEIAERLGFKTVRGSTTRGGVQALRELLRASRGGHLAITPDGPRGPRRVVEQGAVFLAARTGLPVVPLGTGYQHCWQAQSWDRFAVPKPRSRAIQVAGEPIHVPRDADRGALEHFRVLIEQRMHEVTELAQKWAEAGVPAEWRPRRRAAA